MYSHRTAALLKQIAKKSILPDLTGFTEKKENQIVRKRIFMFLVCGLRENITLALLC